MHDLTMLSAWWRRYVCALASVTLQASYLLLVERSGAEKGIGVAELLVYNAILSMPCLLGVSAPSPPDCSGTA